MLKIRGNKVFFEWWDNWMSRIHPNGTRPQPTSAAEQNSKPENKNCGEKRIEGHTRQDKQATKLSPETR